MSVKHAILGILAEGPMHGYDLKRSFDERLGDFWSLNVGQIYTTLERLLSEGLVVYDAVEQADKPDKKVYRITDSGRDELRDWRTRPIKAEPRALRDELFVKLLFIEETEIDLVLGLIQAQQSVYMAQMMQLTNRKFEIEQQTRHSLKAVQNQQERRQIERQRFIRTLLLDVALMHAEADIRWLRQCETRLKDLAQGGA
jgi:DNA-binding PadR family transcriptional regulator